MTEPIQHECGIALLRLLRPLSYYHKKYGTALYGIGKLYLLMEKQRNRGQDGAGVVNIKFDVEPGTRFASRYRSMSHNALDEIFQKINHRFHELEKSRPEKLADTRWLKKNIAFTGELFLGHLRYGTYGKNSIEYCHPFLRQNNWMTRTLVLAGNFNLTNTDELFQQLVELGQHPKEKHRPEDQRLARLTPDDLVHRVLQDERDREVQRAGHQNHGQGQEHPGPVRSKEGQEPPHERPVVSLAKSLLLEFVVVHSSISSRLAT